MSVQLNDSNITDIQNQSARLNLNQQAQHVTFIQKLQRIHLFKLSRKNIFKGIFLIVIILATFWMASNLLHETLIRDRTPFKFGSGSKQVQQIGAPDDLAYRSFYYYNQMVKLAKQNVKNNVSLDSQNLAQYQFSGVTFWELYGLFKVVKAIQLANGYQDVNKDKNQTDNSTDDSKYDNIDNLTAAVNYTSHFNKAADQAMCASCYSFPVVASIEFQAWKMTGKKVKLSQQQLIDCSALDQNANGCHNGNMTRGFQYSKQVGLVQEKSYPYRSQTGNSYKCNSKIIDDQSIQKYSLKSFRSLPQGDCKSIQYQLVTGNAVATMINTGRMNQIKNYSQPFRDCLKTSPNHAVTIVGQTQNQDWIVRNSWGQSWGNNGYFVIRKGNTCGICNHAIVPQLQQIKQN